MAVWKNKGLKYATIVLAVLSLLSVVATFGVGFAALLVGGERTERDRTSPLLYPVLASSTAYAAASSLLLTVTIAIALYGLAHKDVSDFGERRGSPEIRETGFQESPLAKDLEAVALKVKEVKEEGVTLKGVAEMLTDGQAKEIASHIADWLQYYRLQPLTPIGCVLLFTGILCGKLAILALMWAKGYAVQTANEDVNKIPYVSFVWAEVVAGVVAPILLLISVLICTAVLDYSSFGRVDSRGLIPYAMPSVKMFKSSESSYWIIADTFYFQTSKKNPQITQTSYNWFSYCDKSFVTWGLAAIVSIAFMEAAATFANLTVNQAFAYDSCDAVDLETDKFSCYIAGSWKYINCSESNSTDIRCLRFNSSITFNDTLQALIGSYAVYVIVLKAFQSSFRIVKALLQCQPTKLWAALVVLSGIVLTLFGIVFFGYSFRYALKYKQLFLYQVTLLGGCIVIIGGLLLKIKWEKQDEEEEIELISAFHNLANKKLGGILSGPS